MVLKIHADTCKVFTSPLRLKIITHLRDGEHSVGELTEALNVNQPNISQHLAILRDKKIVKARKDGTNIYYRVANPKIFAAFDIMLDVILEQLNESSQLIQNLKKSDRNGRRKRHRQTRNDQ